MGLLLLGAAPFLTLQAVFDWGVTGNPWKTPYVSYLEQNQPGSVFGSDGKEISRPTTNLPQKQIYFAQLTNLERRARSRGVVTWLRLRGRTAAISALPFASLLLLVPAGFLMGRDRQRWALLIAAPLCFALYIFNPFFLPHYFVPLTMALAFGAVLGARAIERAIPWQPGRRFAAAFWPAALALLAIGSLPQFDRHVSDEPYHMLLLDHVERTLARIPAPAVVFFHFTPGCNVQEEPVYNVDALSPDDAPIIRAHDLGPRNGELLQYYALRQPDRAYYIMDCRTGAIYPLGNALQAAVAMHVPLNLPDLATADVR